MGNPRSQKNKAHKTRFSSKSSRHVHKQATAASPAAGRSHQSHTTQNARVARLHRNKLVRDQKRSALLAEKRLGGGEAKSVPLVLGLVGLSSKANIGKAKKLLVEQINASAHKPENAMDVAEESIEGIITTHLSHQHKLRVTVIEARQEELQECLAMAKVADVIAFVTTLTCEKDQFVDKTGKLCLSMLRAQGLPTVFGLVLDLEIVPAKKRLDAKKVCVATLEAELPENAKVFTANASEDCEQVLRYLSSHRLASPQWRNSRPFMLAQKLEFVGNEQTPERGTLLFSGYIRGRSLSVNQLVHVSGVGDFQLKQIDLLEDPLVICQGKRLVKEDQMQIESSTGDIASLLHPDSSLQELLIIENTPDTLAGEQTWPTEEELAKAKQEVIQKRKKRQLPKGTSEYQAAWIVDESEEEADDGDGVGEEQPMDGVDMQAEGDEQEGILPQGKGGDKEDALSDVSSLEDGDDYDKHSEMMVEEEQTEKERMAELERVKAAHTADGEFPDEVDTPLDIPARQRFGKYRGLKSLRTSAWDPKELLPVEYGKIFSFENFAKTQRHVHAKAKEVDEGKVDGCVHVGSYVRLHIKDVPTKSAISLDSKYKESPVVVCGLLQHESKMSVLHFSVKKHDNFTEPLRSKESLVFHVGFRVYKTKPIFSTDDINMDKHKLERFLHPGRFCVASIFAPVAFPPLPLVVLKERGSGEGLAFAASGSLKSVDPDRIILKKIVLSGYPQRIQKQKAVVRFMFHNPEDVRWFKPLELWTKYGRRGRIKEPVGTHGSMKCVFDGVLQQRDAVCVSLYKRVYPKWPASMC